MSNTAIESRAPALARSTAQRVADGVVAGYIRALAGSSTEPVEPDEPRSARQHGCEAGRTGWGTRPGRARRHPARRRILLPA